MIKKFFYISLYIICLLIQIASSSFTCSPEYYCNECQYCGEETMDYDLCNYYQIFCKETRKNLKYSPTLKEEYIDYFSLNPDIISFCGQEEYILRDMEKTDKKEIVIFSSKNKFFPNNVNMHCHYYIDLEKSYLLYPYLVFEKGKNKISPFTEGPLRYQISNIFSLNNQIRSQTSKAFACNDIQNSSSTDIGGMINLEIFVDFLDKKYLSPEESLEIKITFDRYYSEEELENNGSSSSTAVAAGSSIGGVIALLAIIFCCKHCGCCGKNN